MRYDHSWLTHTLAEGQRHKYLFFWGHRPVADGSTTASCLSQWWQEPPFTAEGLTYPTAEHYMMAQKALLGLSENGCSCYLEDHFFFPATPSAASAPTRPGQSAP